MATKNKEQNEKRQEADLADITERVRIYTLAAVSRDRYEHSLRTAEMAVKLCKLYGISAERGRLAGIGHDMCKNMDDSLLMTLSSRDGRPFTQLERNKPSLLHGRAAAVKMQEDFDITDKEILEAVAYHTFGREDLCPLAKILYAADKIEPGRNYITKSYLERLFALDLDSMVRTVLEENIVFLQKKGKAVAPESLLFLDSLKKRG